MTARDFMYWLQGFFEVSPSPNTTFTDDQVQTIAKHVDLVMALEGDLPDSRSAFVLGRVLGHVENKNRIQAEELVGRYFKHVLDPKDGPPKVQVTLNTIHGPPGIGGPGGPLARC